jgi:hypothetical protein
MYDYLAKIILLGPSGAGKYVFSLLIFTFFSIRLYPHSQSGMHYVSEYLRIYTAYTDIYTRYL